MAFRMSAGGARGGGILAGCGAGGGWKIQIAAMTGNVHACGMKQWIRMD